MRDALAKYLWYCGSLKADGYRNGSERRQLGQVGWKKTLLFTTFTNNISA